MFQSFQTLEEMRGVFSADDLIPKPKRKGRKCLQHLLLFVLQKILNVRMHDYSFTIK